MEDKPQQKQCVRSLHKPSSRELAFFFASGILISTPFALYFEQFDSLLPSTLQFIVLGVVLAPFIEELAKVFPLFYRHGETERSIVTLGILIGLGFGIFEFFEYVFLLGVPLIDGIPHIIFHASTPAITSYGIAKKKPAPYYLLAVLIHAANNFFVAEAALPIGLLAEWLVIIIVYLLAWNFYHKASKEKIVV